ncbi:MAG TPA: mRNA surveillance protein pelota [Candidatus Methanofastidiosa archaeon]|nr:mRNA surveillance protein pelota [Candidatus Methanofastidiosa archaeon]HPR40956.1 mRNA surveillance protein pelota [Candidatus Methanofastidiosa archaeon]
MKIIHKDLSKGEIKLKIETLDDLWHLSQIVESGDDVYSVTYRRQQSRNDMVRSDKTEKVRVYMGIKVEKMEFSHYSDTLRLTGVIIEGDQMGSYHTLNIEVGSTPKIIKAWKGFQLDRIQEAIRSSKEPKILIVAIDEGESDFGIVKQYGIDFIASINRNIPGKREMSQRKSEKMAFFKEVADKIESIFAESEIKAAIVAGPGFVKDDFFSWIKENMPKLTSRLNMKNISVNGRTGIWEVVKRGYVEEIYEESRVANEIALIEDLFRKILEDMAVYGTKEVREAIEASQAEYVLVTDDLLRTSEEVQDIIKMSKKFGTRSHIISTSHEGGDKLNGIGGIAAALRFKTAY